MKNSKILALLACCLSVLFVAPVSAEYILWHSPLTGRVAAYSSSLDLTLGIPSTCLRVTATEPGDLLWVDIPLTLPSDVVINGVIVCYENTTQTNYISQVRLTRTRTPVSASVIHDDGTDLMDGTNCYLSEVNQDPVEGTITLALRFHFDDPGAWIEIGGIGIVVEPVFSDVNLEEGELADHVILEPNRPNPFGPSTMISYALDQSAEVTLDILDVGGRVVNTLIQASQPAGEYRICWDGTDYDGTPMPTGKYYYRVQAGDEENARGMILIR